MGDESVHGGQHIVDSAREAGVTSVFTLSGAHIFPVYDAAVGGRARVESTTDRRMVERDGPLRLVDTRHEQTAVFAAEAVGRLTRTPGFAAVTAGPGVTNAVSGIATAWFNRTPLVVLGGRSPDSRWGQGALQELDQPPLLAPITKAAWTTHDAAHIRADADRAFHLAASVRRGPVFWDIPIDAIYSPAPRVTRDPIEPVHAEAPDPDGLARAVRLLDAAERPLLILGSGVWMSDAVEAARHLVAERGLPVIANGMGRGVIPPSDPHLVTRARSTAFREADLVVVVGTPLDFRLGYGVFGEPGAPVVHVVEHADERVDERADERATVGTIEVTVVGDLPATLEALANGPSADAAWAARLRDAARAAVDADRADLASDSDPIHPARIYGELLPRLTADAVVIGDGGDFVSFAGRYIEPEQPGRWLDPGPYGCLGTGPGFALAAGITHPGSPLFLLMGDGAAGFALSDIDSLVRHRIPAVIVVGNNAGWALEKHPMRWLYGYDVIADLPATRYDEIAIALGGGGETVTDPAQIGPALDRAMAAGLPYLVNVLTDPEAAYPRSTLGI
jgi:acetolactate synthase-1/2/3 large subunit